MKTSSGDRARGGSPDFASDPAAQPSSPSTPPIPLVALSQVTSEHVRWLSPGRLAAGKITVLDGDPGLGKSTLLCEFAARISRGDPLPGGEAGPPQIVVILSAEDDLHDTIRPRVEAAGGDPRRVLAFAAPSDRVSLESLASIPDNVINVQEILRRTNAALLVIDPLVAFLTPGYSANSDQSVRRAFHALKDLGERSGAAIVVVRHLNKSPTANPLYRGGGSIGIIGAARSGLLLAADPDDPDRRILASTKGNLGVPPPSLAFRLVTYPGSHVARVVWDGESQWSAEQLLRESASGAASHSLLSEAREWLSAELADGSRPAREIRREAGEAGIGRNLLYAAAKLEGVRFSKERVAGGRWIWSSAATTRERPGVSDPREVREVREVRSSLPPEEP